MKAWDYKTGQCYELLTKKQAVELGWAKASDDIRGVKLMAVPIPATFNGMFAHGIFSCGFEFANGKSLESLWDIESKWEPDGPFTFRP
jgi:hypothetical protein